MGDTNVVAFTNADNIFSHSATFNGDVTLGGGNNRISGPKVSNAIQFTTSTSDDTPNTGMANLKILGTNANAQLGVSTGLASTDLSDQSDLVRTTDITNKPNIDVNHALTGTLILSASTDGSLVERHASLYN